MYIQNIDCELDKTYSKAKKDESSEINNKHILSSWEK